MVRRLANQQAVGKKTANGCVVLKPPVLFNGHLNGSYFSTFSGALCPIVEWQKVSIGGEGGAMRFLWEWRRSATLYHSHNPHSC